MTEAPFHMLREGMPIIVLNAFINGEGPFEFVLDTGNAAGKTSTLLVSAALARRFALELSRSEEFDDAYAVGDASRPEIFLGRIDSFALGDIVLKDVWVGVTTMLDQLSEQAGVKIDGNIGYCFLKDYAVSIDYEAHILGLQHGGQSERGELFRRAPKGSFIVVQALVNGRGPYDFVVDTGAGHTVISDRVAAGLALEGGKKVEMRGGAGNAAGYMTHIDTLQAAGAVCGRTSIVVAGFFSDLSKAAGMQLDGIIGYNVLRGFRVTIDYPHSTISLRERVYEF